MKETITTTANYNITDTERIRQVNDYNHLLERMRDSFKAFTDSNIPLFTTNASDLYDIFLNNIPYEARQEYECHTCRNFVNRYGGLVAIDENGDIMPVMWVFTDVGFFNDAVKAIYKEIKKSKITGVFITSEKRLGTPKTGYWTHMSVDVPKDMIYSSKLKYAEQRSAEKREDFDMLLDAVSKYTKSTIETAVNLLRSDSLYRSEKVLDIAEWFLSVVRDIEGKRGRNRTNLLWKRSASAPNGFCHISSSMIGTLLDDIDAGCDFNTVKQKFNHKMDPLKYQRPQAKPSAGNVARAEEIVEKLGIANSLKRRYARLDEIQKIWVPWEENYTIKVTSAVFSDVVTKEKELKSMTRNIHATETTMTWEKFRRTVLPTAKKIEMKVDGYSRYYFAALVTADDKEAPPIIRWDSLENRNPFSWYLYCGGSYCNAWGLTSGYKEVTGIALQPNMWLPGYDDLGNGVIFILKGCQDINNNSLGLFPEILRGELREVRATIESYSKNKPLSGQDEASACGILLQDGYKNWKCNLRVTTDVGISFYSLDRWD